MARYRKNKMSLYEAMTQSRRKGGYGKLLERLRGSKPAAGRVEQKKTEQESVAEKADLSGVSSGVAQAKPEAQAKSDVATPKMTTTWFRRPRTVQFNTGRIEFSMSYPVAIAIVLGLILLFLLVFRAGQYYSFLSKQPAGGNPAGVKSGEDIRRSSIEAPRKEAGLARHSESEGGGVSQDDLSAGSTADKSPAETKVEFTTPTVSPATPKVGNVIVIVEYSKRADLVPVQKYFAKSGIETEIANWDGKYFLITKNRFEGFGPDSDGYQAKQKIIEVGAKYKAPQGYETFAPLFFKDAYGKKIE